MTPEELQETRAAVQGLIAEVLTRKRVPRKPEELVEGLSLTRDLGIDSLDILQLSATIEKRYRLKIPEDELRGMDDLGGILAAIARNWPAP